MYRYDASYLESVWLSDGSQVLLRQIRPTDKVFMQEAFGRLTPHSRYERFMGTKAELSDHELRYFTEFDGIDHFAIGAIFGGPPGPPRGAGAGRFVRLDHPADTAEPAVTVVDEFQGKGLGTILLERLQAAASERHIRHFHMELFAQNVAMKRLAETVSHHEVKTTHDEAGTLIAVFQIPEPLDEPSSGKPKPIFQMLGHIAREDVTALRRSTLPPPPPQ